MIGIVQNRVVEHFVSKYYVSRNNIPVTLDDLTKNVYFNDMLTQSLAGNIIQLIPVNNTLCDIDSIFRTI